MDGLVEDTEQFELTIADPLEGTGLGTPSSALVRILNTGSFEFEWDHYWAQEGEDAVQVGISRNANVEIPAALDVYTVDGTARAGLDYVSVSNRVQFAANERLQFVSVPILEDAFLEGPETFTLKLANPPEGFALGTNLTATVKILDDDPTVHFESNTDWVREDAGSIEVRVKRGGGGGRGPFTVGYATKAITATPGEDYFDTRGTLAFGEGETVRWFNVPIVADQSPERDEQFLIELSQAEGGAELGPATNISERVTIHDTSGETPHDFDQLRVASDGGLSISLRGKAHSRFNDFLNLFPLEQSSDLGRWSALGMPFRTNRSVAPLTFVGSIPRGMASGFFRTPTRQFLTPTAPPTGPYAVGRLDRWLTDPSRRNRFGVSTNNAFQVSIWYPAVAKAGAWPLPWFDTPVARDATLVPSDWMDRLPHLVEYAAAGLDLVPEPRRLPIILLSVGGAAARQDSWEKADELASHGYLVVAPDHHDAWGVVLPDGRYCRRIEMGIAASVAIRERVRDLVFLTDQVERWAQADPLLQDRLDLGRIGVVGFSWGGGTAMAFCQRDPRCRAAVILDAAPGDGAEEVAQLGLQEPTLSIFNGGWMDRRLFDSTAHDAFIFQVQGTDHNAIGGWSYFPTATAASKAGARRVNRSVNAYMIWFLNRYLQGSMDPMPRLADHPLIQNLRQK